MRSLRLAITVWLNKLAPPPSLFRLGRPWRPFLFAFVIPANPPAPLPPAKTRMARLSGLRQRASASVRPRPLLSRPASGGPRPRRGSASKPERAAGYGLGGKRGRGRTLVRRVRGEPFDEALCAGSADLGGSLPLQTLFVGAFVGLGGR